MVSLRHLKALTMTGFDTPRLTLFDHLSIPIGASLASSFTILSEKTTRQDYFPERPPNLDNLSYITTVNLLLNLAQAYVRLNGPSGSRVRVRTWWRSLDHSPYTTATSSFPLF